MSKRKRIFSTPTRTICISFAIIILAGSLLLMLPICNKDGQMISFLDACFTATSATCVTGLVVFDTFTQFTGLGQGVILALIQLGGLGFVTFSTFFSVALGKKMALRSMQLAQESFNTFDINDVTRLVKFIMAMVFTVEFAGALVLSTTFIPKYGLDGIWISVFLAVSAFCNAGFDILGREGAYASLINYNDNPTVLITIALLIIIGGLGFIVWNELLNYHKTHKFMLHTKVVLIVTAILLVVGTLGFMAFEWNNPETMGPLPTEQKVLSAFFQSTTLRTAGFNSLDFATMFDITKILSIILMFIGAAPGSTGGGVKVSTFAVVLMTVVSVVKGREDTQILGRKIDKKVVYRALAIIIISLFVVGVATCIIYLTSNPGGVFSGVDIMLEVVSGFGTVGVTSGVTAAANAITKVVLILSMFIGRVGPVSLAISLTMSGSNKRNQVIPEGKIIVG